MHEATAEGIEGIVIYDPIDRLNDYYGARTRHQVIARVVWERCATSTERDAILREAIKHLNITYKPDAIAFEHFIRSVKTVDSIESFDERTAFFEEACKKDPFDPYIRQHYARMLHRAGKFELAYNQIERAISLDKTVRVLNHTKGLILADMALQQSNFDAGRRYLARSEECFKNGTNAAPRDPYNYESLARLYFDWAKHVSELDERSLYLSRAETVISEGLRFARERENLWMVSADIQGWLHQTPEQISALERAVAEILTALSLATC